MLPLTFLLAPVQMLALRFNWKLSRKIPVFWHRLLARMIGLRISLAGSPNRDRPLLLVANHVSWSDIIVLGTIPDICFIAKEEVSTTPFAGMLARLQRSVFVKREETRKSAEQAKEITARLLDGDIMVLFAEGTTGDGNYILPFKSSLFGAVQYALNSDETERVFVQPVSIAYTHFMGIRMGRRERARSSWPGDLELAPHALEFMRASTWDVEVSFGSSIEVSGAIKRRELAMETRATVRKLFAKSVYQRQRI